MTNKEKSKESVGPQGTQFFNLGDVNKMIAAKEAEMQSEAGAIPALVGTSNSVKDQKFVFTKDKLEIGRRHNSDIALNVASVSAMHAQIIKDGSEWKVINLLSSNGTFVNGEKVTSKVIRAGDHISFAGAEFIFTFFDPEEKASSGSSAKIIWLVLGFAAVAAGLYYAWSNNLF